jgi:hypothetical protein
MTVKEMHLDVVDQVQQLSANRSRKLHPDQLDWALTRVQQMMVESAVTPVQGSGRYQIKEKKQDWISSLIVNRESLGAGWITDQYVSFLPSDFWYLLDDASRLAQLCAGDIKTVNHTIFKITRVPFPLSSLPTGCYGDVDITYSNSSIFNLDTLLTNRQKAWDGFPSSDAHFYIKDLIIEELSKKGLQVYWEKFNNLEYPYHFVFVSTQDISIELTLDGQSYAGITEDLTQEVHSSSRSTVLSPNTMITHDKEFSTGTTPYFKTSYISPISAQKAGIINTVVDNSFIVYETVINYIRKPPTISLSLGTNCSLSPSIHQQLCNKTVELILNRIKDESWKDVTQQNTINSQ